VIERLIVAVKDLTAMTRRITLCATLGAMLALAIAGCDRDAKREWAAVKAVTEQFSEAGVDLSTFATELGALTFLTGELDGGRAVYFLNADAAFWVNEGHVYAVDDNARRLCPDLEAAPEHITHDAVLEVAE